MIKKIKRPIIDFKFYVSRTDDFYYDDINNEYFLKNYSDNIIIYFSIHTGKKHRDGNYAVKSANELFYYKNGKLNRIDGAALIIDNIINFSYYFYIDEKWMYEKEFAKETNHLICKFCEEFCKQRCF